MPEGVNWDILFTFQIDEEMEIDGSIRYDGSLFVKTISVYCWWSDRAFDVLLWYVYCDSMIRHLAAVWLAGCLTVTAFQLPCHDYFEGDIMSYIFFFLYFSVWLDHIVLRNLLKSLCYSNWIEFWLIDPTHCTFTRWLFF